jgi:hypothetical protein
VSGQFGGQLTDRKTFCDSYQRAKAMFFIVLCSTSFSFNPKVGTAFRKECGTVFMQPVVVHFVHKGGKCYNGNPSGKFSVCKR